MTIQHAERGHDRQTIQGNVATNLRFGGKYYYEDFFSQFHTLSHSRKIVKIGQGLTELETAKRGRYSRHGASQHC